jgi:hypothetical protein
MKGGYMKKPYTLHLTEEQIAKLKKIYEKDGVPVSWSIRKAIDEYLKTKKSKK